MQMYASTTIQSIRKRRQNLLSYIFIFRSVLQFQKKNHTIKQYERKNYTIFFLKLSIYNIVVQYSVCFSFMVWFLINRFDSSVCVHLSPRFFFFWFWWSCRIKFHLPFAQNNTQKSREKKNTTETTRREKKVHRFEKKNFHVRGREKQMK